MSEPVVLASSQRWTIPSDEGRAGLCITMSIPPHGVRGPVPILLLLDGDFMFLTATEFVRTLNLVTMGEFPPVVVVGLMRDESDPLQYASSRFRDFTPQQWLLPGPFAEDNALTTMGTGGAKAFMDDVEHRALPRVRERLSAEGMTAGDVAIGGWSLSGLCASWAWLERPEVFAHLLAISPSLWWNDASILDAPMVQRPEGHRAFVCAGEHEEGDPARVYPQRFANPAQRELAAMVRNAHRFGERLTEVGACVACLTFSDEHHVTLQSAAIARGLVHLFG